MQQRCGDLEDVNADLQERIKKAEEALLEKHFSALIADGSAREKLLRSFDALIADIDKTLAVV